MPIDHYSSRSPDEVQQLLRTVEGYKAKGLITEVSAAGVRTTRAFPPGYDVDKEIFDLRMSLFLKDPDNFTDPRLERIRKVRPYYVDQ